MPVAEHSRFSPQIQITLDRTIAGSCLPPSKYEALEGACVLGVIIEKGLREICMRVVKEVNVLRIGDLRMYFSSAIRET